MGREIASIDSFRAELNTAIEYAIENHVIDGAKTAIQESEERNVYSYVPIWDWAEETRRKEAGGIQDKKNMIVHPNFASTEEKSIEIEIVSTWQWADPLNSFENVTYEQLQGGPNPTGDLVQTIENRGMYAAPPRPFMQDAEQTYGNGQFEIDLMQGLKEHGFD